MTFESCERDEKELFRTIDLLIGSKIYHQILRPSDDGQAEYLRIEWHEPNASNVFYVKDKTVKANEKKSYSGWYLSFLTYSAQDGNLHHEKALQINKPIPFKSSKLDSGTQYLFKGDGGEVFWFEQGNGKELWLKVLSKTAQKPDKHSIKIGSVLYKHVWDYASEHFKD